MTPEAEHWLEGFLYDAIASHVALTHKLSNKVKKELVEAGIIVVGGRAVVLSEKGFELLWEKVRGSPLRLPELAQSVVSNSCTIMAGGGSTTNPDYVAPAGFYLVEEGALDALDAYLDK